jgi:hypothetical protein
MAPAAPYPRRLRDHASRRTRSRSPIRQLERIVNLMMLTVDLLQDVQADGEHALEQLAAFEQED